MSGPVGGVVLIAFGLMAACSTAPPSQEGKDELIRQATTTLRDWNDSTPGIERFARASYGYAVFPEIGKGGLGLGAAYGRGVVYEQGEHIGYADLTHASLGLQVGGQVYQVLVVLDDKVALERLKQGPLEFSADASGVVFTTGYATAVRFIEGIMILARPVGGVMGEASVGSQWFTFVQKDEAVPRR